MTALFAISDHHFGHENIIKYYPSRGSLNALEDAKKMILAHNETVGPEDLVVFVGDISASSQGRQWIGKIIPKLNGRKILIKGNHDHLSDAQYLAMGFERIEDVMVIGEFIFCHYPNHPEVITLAQERNLKIVAGHTHKEFPEDNYGDKVERINVNVDVIGPYPLLLGEI